jgi:DNA mismatch repair protein MutS2
MDLSVIHTLEFDKIRAMLAASTGSAIGRELAEALEPVSDYGEVERRLAETQEAYEIILKAINPPLGGIRDVRPLIKRAEIGATLEPHEFVAIAGTLYAARRVKQFFAELAKPTPRLAEALEQVSVFRPLENNIENTISEQGTVRDTASTELNRIRREIRLTQNRIKEKIDGVLHSADYQKYFQDVLVTIRGDRYVIPVKQEYRHNFPGIVHDQSASGATVFIEPMAVVNLNNDLKQLAAAEHNEVERILRALTAQIAGVAEPLYLTCEGLGKIDFAFAKARLALSMEAALPALNSRGQVNLRQARHPLIPQEVAVPIDIRLGKEFQIMVITGPNTGGKTVSLKTLGLFALMVQSGLFVPVAFDSEMAVFENVFADIGDEQSIEQSLSTFSAHMTNLVRILRRVGSRDLVLIDEIGAGTDPDEGAALAMAILEYLHNQEARTVATTHYSELKTFAYARHGIENASVEFDIHTLKPTYRLLIGQPGSSKAFLISQRLGLKEAIIERAKELVDEDYAEFDKVLTGLEEQKRIYAERQQEAAKLKREMEELRARVSAEQEALAGKKNQILAKAQDEAAQVLRKTRLEAEAIIADLKAQFASQTVKERQQAIENARKRLKRTTSGLHSLDDDDAMPEGTEATVDQLTPGTLIYVTSLGQKGTVVSAGGDEAVIQLGIMKVNVPIANCRIIEGVAPKEKVARRSDVNLAKAQETSRQIDIRGLNIEEAETVLEKYIDDAILAGLGELIIIHGKGTGALRKGVRSFLKEHPSIKSMRIGEVSEGGDGVTVVKLI